MIVTRHNIQFKQYINTLQMQFNNSIPLCYDDLCHSHTDAVSPQVHMLFLNQWTINSVSSGLEGNVKVLKPNKKAKYKSISDCHFP